MKRNAVVQKLKKAAKAKGLPFEELTLSKHDAVKVGNTTKTLGRHSEIPDNIAKQFFDEFASELGKGWWR